MSNDYDAAWAERVATESPRLNFHIRLGLRALAKRIRELEEAKKGVEEHAHRLCDEPCAYCDLCCEGKL